MRRPARRHGKKFFDFFVLTVAERGRGVAGHPVAGAAKNDLREPDSFKCAFFNLRERVGKGNYGHVRPISAKNRVWAVGCRIL